MQIIITNKAELRGASPYWKKTLMELFTLQNPQYLNSLKMGRKPYGIPKDIRYYERRFKSLYFPRGAVGLIYQNILPKESVQIYDQTFVLTDIDISFKGELRPYQKEAVQNILTKRFGVLESGTGSGKTVMALSIISERKQPTLILVHTKELLYQWQSRIKSFLNIDCGLIGDGIFELRPISVAIVKTAEKNLEKIKNYFGHLVVDECHRVPASTFKNIVLSFSCRYMLGLSATPFRSDGLDQIIGWYLGTHRVTIDQKVLRDTGAVLRPNVIIRETKFGYGKKNKDYQEIIASLIQDKDRNNMIVQDIEEQSKDGNLSLVVSDRIDHLNILSEMISTKHIILTGGTPAKERQKIIKDLSNGKILVLFSTLSLIGEGFDCPNMTNLFITMPIKFEGRLTQVVGRILRPQEGKTPNVFDYFDQHVGMLKKQGIARQKIYSVM